MTLSWDAAAWEDFQYWLDTDKATARKIRALLKECLRTPTYRHGQARSAQARLCWLLVAPHQRRAPARVPLRSRFGPRHSVPLPLRAVGLPAYLRPYAYFPPHPKLPQHPRRLGEARAGQSIYWAE